MAYRFPNVERLGGQRWGETRGTGHRKYLKTLTQPSGIWQACTQRSGPPGRPELMKDIPTELKAEPPGAWLSVGSEGTKPVGPAPALPVGPACGGQAGVEAGRCRVPFLGRAVCQLGHGAARDCMCAEHPDCPQRNQPAPDSSQPITYHATSTRVRQHILSCCCVPGVHTHTHTHTSHVVFTPCRCCAQRVFVASPTCHPFLFLRETSPCSSFPWVLRGGWG